MSRWRARARLNVYPLFRAKSHLPRRDKEMKREKKEKRRKRIRLKESERIKRHEMCIDLNAKRSTAAKTRAQLEASHA